MNLEEVIKEIEAVTPERIQKAAARTFQESKESVIVLGKGMKKRRQSVCEFDLA